MLHSLSSCLYFAWGFRPCDFSAEAEQPLEILFLLTDEEARVEKVKCPPQGHRASKGKTGLDPDSNLLPLECHAMVGSRSCLVAPISGLKYMVWLGTVSQPKAQERTRRSVMGVLRESPREAEGLG